MQKKRKKIEEIEIAVLLSLYSKVEYSKHAHPKEETILKGLRKDLRGMGKVALRNMVRKGDIVQHPTSGGMTYSLSQKGVEKLKELRK